MEKIDIIKSITERTGGDIYLGIVEKLCDILTGFSEKMKEYGTVDYCAYATSAIREAKNNQMVLDLIKLRTSFKVQILSNPELPQLNADSLVFRG